MPRLLRDMTQVEMAMIVALRTWRGTSIYEGAMEVLRQVDEVNRRQTSSYLESADALPSTAQRE